MQLFAWLKIVISYSLFAMVVISVSPSALMAQGFVPGTGEKLTKVGDDFEAEGWKFINNYPKSSADVDKQNRFPLGASKNGRWFEGPKRGHPELLKRVKTPPDGLEGSEWSLLMGSRNSGVPGRHSGRMEQDDLIVDTVSRMGGPVRISWSPSFVVRVFMPPVKMWENRTGPTFGIRAGLDTPTNERGKGGKEDYWPGIFVHYQPKTQTARLLIRADHYGRDQRSIAIEQTGWWTMGMSFTPDGKVHYYASPGVDDLTEEDHLASHFPYGHRARRFQTFFFNVCNRDDGRTWSTPWIIDDPALYFIRPGSTASRQRMNRNIGR